MGFDAQFFVPPSMSGSSRTGNWGSGDSGGSAGLDSSTRLGEEDNDIGTGLVAAAAKREAEDVEKSLGIDRELQGYIQV